MRQDPEAQIWTTTADSGLAAMVGVLSVSSEGLSWSPDGRSVAYGQDGDLHVFDLSLGASEPWVTDPAADVLHSWSQASDQLLFSSDREGEWELYAADTEGRVTRLTDGGWQLAYAAWSASGEAIALCADSPTRTGLYLRDLRPVRLTGGAGYDWSPTWISR